MYPPISAQTVAHYLTVPIIQGGMQWVAYAELASAVSNAGGLGIVRVAYVRIPFLICTPTLTAPWVLPYPAQCTHTSHP